METIPPPMKGIDGEYLGQQYPMHLPALEGPVNLLQHQNTVGTDVFVV
jgi:hypothetical protein